MRLETLLNDGALLLGRQPTPRLWLVLSFREGLFQLLPLDERRTHQTSQGGLQQRPPAFGAPLGVHRKRDCRRSELDVPSTRAPSSMVVIKRVPRRGDGAASTVDGPSSNQ